MKEILKLSLALGLVCAIAGILLSAANSQTREAKKAAETRQQSIDLAKVLPTFGNQPLDDTVTVGAPASPVVFHRARADGDGPVTAVAGQAAAKGFGGPVRVLVGIDPDGRVRKVLVVAHQETPGLGTQVTDRRQPVTIFELFRRGGDATGPQAETVAPNAFLDGFDSFVFDPDTDIEVSLGELQPVSGATISSDAVARAVALVARQFVAHRATILDDGDSH